MYFTLLLSVHGNPENVDKSDSHEGCHYRDLMRWESLFADLENQMVAAEEEDRRADVSARTRSDRASVELVGRLLASVGRPLQVLTSDGMSVEGVLTEACGAWVLLVDAQHREHLIPLAQIAGLIGAAAFVAPAGVVDRRLTLASALRAIARDRARVEVVTQGYCWWGVINAVGSDHCDLDRGRDTGAASRAGVTVPFHTLVRISSTPWG